MPNKAPAFGNQYDPQAPRARVTPLVKKLAEQYEKEQEDAYKGKRRKED